MVKLSGQCTVGRARRLQGIDPRDWQSSLSIVIQGPIASRDTAFRESLYKLRRLLPEAEMILSSWSADDARQFDFVDACIVGEDPGAQATGPTRCSANLNRQIVSTAAGVRAASRGMIVKIRSDFVLERPMVPLSLSMDRWARATADDGLEDDSLIISDMHRGQWPIYPYYISDWWHFGNAAAMRRMWGQALQNQADAQYFNTAEPRSMARSRLLRNCQFSRTGFWSRYHSEQFLALGHIYGDGTQRPIEHREDYGWNDLWRAYAEMVRFFAFIPRGELFNVGEEHPTFQQGGDVGLVELARRAYLHGDKSAEILLKSFGRSYCLYQVSRRGGWVRYSGSKIQSLTSLVG